MSALVSPCFPSEPSLIVPGEKIAEPIDNFLNDKAGTDFPCCCYELSFPFFLGLVFACLSRCSFNNFGIFAHQRSAIDLIHFAGVEFFLFVIYGCSSFCSVSVIFVFSKSVQDACTCIYVCAEGAGSFFIPFPPE